MAVRSQWKGYLKISLVSIPVKAFTTTASGAGGVALNQLHAECNRRIQYKKFCPEHGEVPKDQIVSGFEYSKDQYVRIDTDELAKLRTEDESKAIQVDNFIGPETLDPLYLTGRNYFLVPEGPVGQNAFHVICQAMVDAKRHAIGQVVMHGKEQLVMLRPYDGLLVMSVLNFNSQVSGTSIFEEEIPKGTINPQELEMARALIKASAAEKFDFAKYKDVYTEKLTQLIEAKVAGKELVSPPPSEQYQVINLMDALTKSVERARKSAPAPAAGEPAAEAEPAPAKKPPKKMAPSKEPRQPQVRKRKSS